MGYAKHEFFSVQEMKEKGTDAATLQGMGYSVSQIVSVYPKEETELKKRSEEQDKAAQDKTVEDKAAEDKAAKDKAVQESESLGTIRSLISKNEISSVITMLRSGTAEGKANAVAALNWESVVNANQVKDCIGPLIALIRDGDTQVKENALYTLFGISGGNDAAMKKIAAEGGIGLLIELVRDATDNTRGDAASLLGNLACNDANVVKIAAEGGIGALIALVRDGSVERTRSACFALSNLASNDANKKKIRDAGLQIIVAAKNKETNAAEKKRMRELLGKIKS